MSNDPGSKRNAFLNSQFAKMLFDCLGIDPGDYDDETELLNELNVRLNDTLTIQGRLLEALDIDEEDPNKYELLTERVTKMCHFLEQYDVDGDGEIESDDENDSTEDEDSGETIDETLDRLEESNSCLNVLYQHLQQKYDRLAIVVKDLIKELSLCDHLDDVDFDDFDNFVGEIEANCHNEADESDEDEEEWEDDEEWDEDDNDDGEQEKNAVRKSGKSKTNVLKTAAFAGLCVAVPPVGVGYALSRLITDAIIEDSIDE